MHRELRFWLIAFGIWIVVSVLINILCVGCKVAEKIGLASQEQVVRNERQGNTNAANIDTLWGKYHNETVNEVRQIQNDLWPLVVMFGILQVAGPLVAALVGGGGIVVWLMKKRRKK